MRKDDPYGLDAYVIRIMPQGEIVDGPMSRREADVYVETFNRVMKGSDCFAEKVLVRIKPIDDQAPEQSQ
jgi:hypothetical protein